MGWTWSRASYYKNGKVDILAEVLSVINWESPEYGKCEAIRSAKVGNVVFAAAKRTAPGKEPIIFAVIFDCKTDMNHPSLNFGYKDMDETCGPCNPRFFKCPLAIINLLSPTDNEWANEWRENVRQYHKEKNALNAAKRLLDKFPIGTRIKVLGMVFTKRLWQPNKPLWMRNGNQPIPVSLILREGYEVLPEEE